MHVPITVLALFLAAGGNLLANAGFEETAGDRPVRWDLFMTGEKGAYARLDGRAFTGRLAALIHNPLPFKQDPAHNWSQNVFGDFGGRRLRLAGLIRTEEATRAALWLQCWKRGKGLLQTATSDKDAPVYGNRDWQAVALHADVPKDTDFVTVRCVLEGTGTAWFDDVTLELVEADPDFSAPQEGGKPAAQAAPAAQAPGSEAPPPLPEAPAVSGLPEGREELLLRLELYQESLTGELQRVRSQNAVLIEELARLRKRLEELQADIDRLPVQGPKVPAIPVVPPLAPREAERQERRVDRAQPEERKP